MFVWPLPPIVSATAAAEVFVNASLLRTLQPAERGAGQRAEAQVARVPALLVQRAVLDGS